MLWNCTNMHGIGDNFSQIEEGLEVILKAVPSCRGRRITPLERGRFASANHRGSKYIFFKTAFGILKKTKFLTR